MILETEKTKNAEDLVEKNLQISELEVSNNLPTERFINEVKRLISIINVNFKFQDKNYIIAGLVYHKKKWDYPSDDEIDPFVYLLEQLDIRH